MAHSLDPAVAFLVLGVVVVAAEVAGWVGRKLQLPPVVAQIVVGLMLGPSLTGWIDPTNADVSTVLTLIGEIGVLLLIFEVGVEIDPAELRRVGVAATSVAVVGVVVPVTAGAGALLLIGTDGHAALLAGVTLAATSVGITARVFSDARALSSVEAQVVLGAAVIDDVLGLLVLSVAVPIVSGDGVTLLGIGEIAAKAIGFLLVGTWIALRVVPRAVSAVSWRRLPGGSVLVAGLALAFFAAAAASSAGLAPIIGAVIAGLAIGRSDVASGVGSAIQPIAAFTVPVFFVGIGVTTDLSVLASWSSLAVALLLSAVGVAGKVVAGLAVGRTGADRWAVGLGMVPRGEVGLIVAAIGRSVGVFTPEIDAALLVAVIGTSLVGPIALRARMSRLVDADVETGRELDPSDGAVVAALGLAARIAAGEQVPGDEVSRLSRRFDGPIAWPAGATHQLATVLRAGHPKALRLLDVSGFWAATLPSVDEAIDRRRDGLVDLDPDMPLRWQVVAALHDDTVAHLSDATVLAGFALDVTRDLSDDESQAVARDLLATLLADDRSTAWTLTHDAIQLVRAARSPLGVSTRRLARLGAALLDPGDLGGAERVARAVCGIEDELSTERLADVVGLLRRHFARGRSAAALAAQVRRDVAANAGERVVARLEGLSDALVGSARADWWIGVLSAVDPVPAPRRCRVLVELVGHGEQGEQDGPVEPTKPSESEHGGRPARTVVRLTVVARVVTGVAGTVARVIAERGADVVSATTMAWPDGAWLGRYEVRWRAAETAADVDAFGEQLRADIAVALGRGRRRLRQQVPELTSLSQVVDDGAGHSVVIIDAPDRPGLLADVLATVESSAVRLVGAEVGSVTGDDSGTVAHQRLELAHRSGRPLTEGELARAVRRLGAAR